MNHHDLAAALLANAATLRAKANAAPTLADCAQHNADADELIAEAMHALTQARKLFATAAK